MRSAHKVRTPLIAVIVAITMSLSLSGCFANPIEGLVKKGVSGAIKEATGADVEVGGKSLPSDFPKQVPTASSEVRVGIAATGADGFKVWTVQFTVKPGYDLDELRGKMVSAGFVEADYTAGKSIGLVAFEGHGYSIVANHIETDTRNAVAYVVTESKK